MRALSLYAALMSPLWRLRSKINLRKKLKVKKADEIVEKIEEFRSFMLSYEKQENKAKAFQYACYIEALTWVIHAGD